MEKKKGPKKVFVLDTNVLLHDAASIYKFEENDVVIPITVLEELDKFKRGDEPINLNARAFVRSIDKIAGEDFFKTGASLGEGKGRLFIHPCVPFSEKIKNAFREDIPDHRILAVADYLSGQRTEKVVMVTKDINLRMKARSLGIPAEDYKNDKVGEEVMNNQLDRPTNKRTYKISDELLARLYSEKEGIPVKEFFPDETLEGNCYFNFKRGEKSVQACYDPRKKVIRLVEKRNCYGIYPRNDEQTFALDALMNPDIPLVAISGKAGTGKTLLALAAALQQNENFDQIFLARPIVALSNKDLGFLPGAAEDKVGPYMEPLFDNLAVIRHGFNAHSRENQLIEQMMKDKRLVVSALAFIRGRSLSNVFYIIDESQNLTPHEVKTAITRAGENVKIVFTGDIDQIDSPYLDRLSNGLTYLINHMQGEPLFAHINLEKGERSHLAEVAANRL